jgi:hypothetical protein
MVPADWRWRWRPRGGARRPDPAAGLGDLEAALRCQACPICAQTAGADERWLDHFLYEGYQEPEVMQAVARGGGFCAHHASRVEAIGLSATVAIVYRGLIDDCLPRLDDRISGGKKPLVAAQGACEACAQAREVERRECFFLALLLGARGPRCYGEPAFVCMPHLPQLALYLDADRIEGVLGIHCRALAALSQLLADPPVRCCADRIETAADEAIGMTLGPPGRGAIPPNATGAPFGDDRDPVRRMRRRLNHLDGCAVCAEIGDACAEWLGWLARAADRAGDVTDLLPLCRRHVWQARSVGGAALAPALATLALREAEERLVYAGRAGAPRREPTIVPAAVRRLWPGAAARNAVAAALRRGRECPLCRRAREAGERAIALLAALLEEAAGRRAFENGYGLCLRHAAQAPALPDARAVGNIVASTMHARLALLRWELDEQLRRGAWQGRPERRGSESGAWLRAGARFAGTVA